MRRADGVGLQSFERFEVRTPDNWLSSKMKNKLRPDFSDYAGQAFQISNVTINFASKRMRLYDLVKVWVSRRGQTNAPNFRTQLFEPQGKPSTLEASMSRD